MPTATTGDDSDGFRTVIVGTPAPPPLPGPPPPPLPPHTTSARRRRATIPLVDTFRFVHEPINELNSDRFIGRHAELTAFVERVRFSDGGSFLVTGYRGVGKTSFINHALRQLETAVEAHRPTDGVATRLVTISLNIARPVQAAELMHYIVRRLHDRLVEDGIFSLLDADLRDALKQAYDRTSFNMARKLAETAERSYGVTDAGLSSSVVGVAAKLAWSRKESRTRNYEMTFLGYDDRAAEHDIITITRRLRLGYRQPVARWRRILPWPRVRTHGTRTALKIVFVFDELDKLEEFTIRKDKDDDGRPVIDHILGSLKNLFTTSGVTFVFVAGKDLQERWLEDVGRGDSVYESVFSYDKYLPCMWPDVDSICDHLVAARSPSSAELFDKFKGFLAYKGRGIPRRIVRTFNEYVDWSTGAPVLSFNRQQENRIKFFAGLQDALAEHGKQLFGDSTEETAGTQSDKRRLGVYYLIDWILRQGGEFTLTDAVNASRRLSVKIALAEEIAPRVVEDLIRMLVAEDYLQEAQKKLDKVVIGDPGVLNERKYVVSPRRVVEMGGAVDGDEDWKLADVKHVQGRPVWAPGITRIGPYSVLGLIGQGGMGIVHRATDPHTGRTVAIKVLRHELSVSADAVRRFEREARVMNELRHPNIVRFVDSGTADGSPYIVMEFLEGATLAQVIEKRGRLAPDAALAIALPVIDALRYVHERHIVRNDVKPNNVMLTPAGRVCLLDFGISRYADRDVEPVPVDANVVTAAGVFIGTPLFMAPEQLMGGRVDRRADVYSLGVMLYNMLTRVYPLDVHSASDLVVAMAANTMPEPPSKYVPVPAGLDRVVLKCLARKPEDRYQTMDEVSDALHAAVGTPAPVDLPELVRETLDRVKAIDALGNEATLTGAFSADVDVTSPGVPVLAAARDTTPPAARRSPAPAVPAPDDLDVGKPRITPLPSVYAGDLHLVPSGDSYLLKEKHTTFGRADSNDIVLLSPKASRFHGRFTVEDDACVVEAFGSSNPVLVNGTRVAGRHRLTPGDMIDIGEVRFAFRR